MRKQGQGDMNAAILVAIIAGLIVVYMLFLPSFERERLFEKEFKSTPSNNDDDEEEQYLREFPGLLTVGEDLEDQKDIPNVFLFETTNAKELARLNPFVVKRSVFSEQPKIVSFGLDDLSNTDNVLLSFVARKHKGTLAITLNGEPIFESDLESSNVEPIQLDNGLLSEQNTLEFHLASPGWQFWSTKMYELANLKVTGDITDRSKQESQNVFSLSEDEFENIDKIELQFVPYCAGVGRVGALDVFVNNRNIFSAIPVCDDPYRQIIPNGVLNEGTNKVVFKTNQGSYSVEQIKLKLDFEETRSKTYFFEINESEFDDVLSERDKIVLDLEFVDDDEDKQGILDINGRLRSFDQEDKGFSLIITGFIDEGNNYVRIEPITELNVVELTVERRNQND